MYKKVIAIGGGLGALSGAIYLARMGFGVKLFEQNASLGGKMNEKVMGSYRFDTGPSLLTMPFVIDDLFNFAGFSRSEFLDFVPVDPICRYFFSDGSVMDASANRDRMISSIKAISPSEVSAYDKFLSYAKQIYDFSADIFLFTPIHEIGKVLRKGSISTLFNIHKLDAFRTVHQGVSRFFSDQRLIQLFDRYATYSGSDPFQAPATLNIISYVEYGLGGYYVKGGMYKLVNALEEIAGRLGVEIQKSARVEKILWKGDRIKGVRVNGDVIPADYVLCGADAVIAYDSLIDGLNKRRKKLNLLEPSISGMVFLWGVGKKSPMLKHHNIIFSSDYRREFDQIFGERRVPDDPTVYIAINSKTDPENSPAYGENWFVLLNMPYLTDGQDWDMEIKRMREIILSKLKGIGIDISDYIEAEAVYTPEDFFRIYSSNRGSIYGISSNSKYTAFKHHPNRSRDIAGLYFAGATAHPGCGVPLVMLSGKMSAELIAEAEGKTEEQ